MMQEVAALISQYGLLMIFAIVLLEQLGLPLPAHDMQTLSAAAA